MFKPSVGPISFEAVDDASDWSISSIAQEIQDSALRLIPLTGSVRPIDLSWPLAEWTQADELLDVDDDLQTRWYVQFSNQPTTSPQGFVHDEDTGYLEITTETGSYQTFRQAGTAPLNGQQVWSDNVSNSDGWTVQFRVQAYSGPTGEETHGHYILIDDGTYKEQIHVQQTGLSFLYNPSLDVRADFTVPREIRIAGIGTELFVLVDDGRGFYAPNGLSHASSGAKLEWGGVYSTEPVTSLWDYVNFSTEKAVIDVRDFTDIVYSTTMQYATSPAYSPARHLDHWVMARFKTSGDLADGTTTIAVQYRSSVAAEWTTYSTTTVDEIGWFEVLLDGVPTAEDGTDEIRFRIGQQSATGAAEPPRIEEIAVLVSFAEGAVTMRPSWGHRDGGTTVILDLTEAGREINVGSGGTNTSATTIDEYITLGSIATGAAYTWTDEFNTIDPYGVVMTGWSVTTGDVHLSIDEVATQEAGSVIGHTSQKIDASLTGDGIYSQITGDGLSFLLSIERGSVVVTDGSIVRTFRGADYKAAERVRLELTGDSTITITAGTAGSVWHIADPSQFTLVPNTGESYAGHIVGTAIAADLYITPLVYRAQDTDIVLTDAWTLGMTPDGLPYISVNDGVTTEVLTGNEPLLIGHESLLAFSFRHYGDHNAVELMLDGELIGHKEVSISTVTGGTGITLVGGACEVRDFRSYGSYLDPRDYSQDRGFSPPVFQVEFAPPTGESVKALYRFYEDGGAIADDSGNDHHALLPLDNRDGIYRDRQINAEPCLTLWGNGQILIPHSPDTSLTLPHAIYVEGAFYAGVDSGTLYSKWNDTGTIGLEVLILADGTVQVNTEDGTNSRSLTSNAILADGRRRTLYVGVSTVGITIRIDGVSSSTSVLIGALSSADNDAEVGFGIYAYLRHFIVMSDELLEADYDLWRDWTESKWDPDDEVYFDGDALAATAVVHYSSTRKYAVSPAGSPGKVAVYVTANSIVLPADRPFTYTYGYSRSIPTSKSYACGTLSPFRILSEVPGDAVNLSFIQGQDISVDANVTTIDLAHKELENLSTYHGGEFMVTGAETGSSLLYAGQVDTTDLAVTDRAMISRDWSEPTPLFYEYVIGRGRRYVYQPNATTVEDANVIRNGITLIDGRGSTLPLKDFPWDIAVSKVDAYGETLPDNVFAVALLLADKYIPGKTVQVKYHAADQLNDWDKAVNYVEIVNARPILSMVTGEPSAGEFSLTYLDDGTFDLNLGFTGA